eukprot:TRINITY_DN33595_c0_g1_i1.p1 TRINITY_DN33595_c0_g1~~TRINITY_DN33595_c0_g1_i1.p1  ORF type:complete len:232 (+),score=76.42 TRINITY_DN33595_c0_g1_i1:78-773(+)
MRRAALRAAAAVACPRASSRRLINCMDGVTDDDRRWWEWHIPVRPHKGAQTSVLYLDGIGRYTWKKLIERDAFTVQDVAQLSDQTVEELKQEGCTAVHVAREHARVFMDVLQKRDSGVSSAQTSWEKEAERVLRLREERVEAERARWAAANAQFADPGLWQEMRDAQMSGIESVRAEMDFGSAKASFQQSRFDAALGRERPEEAEGTIDTDAEDVGSDLGSQSEFGKNPFR